MKEQALNSGPLAKQETSLTTRYSVGTEYFCNTSLPPTSIRWVRSTIKLFALSTVSK